MQGAFDAGAVVVVEIPDPFHDVLDFFMDDLSLLTQGHLSIRVAGRWKPAEVEDDLEEVVLVPVLGHGFPDGRLQDGEQIVEVVSYLLFFHNSGSVRGAASPPRPWADVLR